MARPVACATGLARTASGGADAPDIPAKGDPMPEQDAAALRRGLKNRHIQMIALGGAIGTGLFYGSAASISLAGPAVLLSYGIGGVIIYLIMRMMGEMAAEEPVAGAFSHFAYAYWGEFPGFLSGWNYWFLYVFVSMAELSVVGIYVNYWLPDFPQWLTSLCILAGITAVNMLNVKMFGE
ncbi:MAG: amino acid permease, partial [Desulfovibrionaceae bacterium]|nr:amino acid permease [Desulfovibrionaceae bacterium]